MDCFYSASADFKLNHLTGIDVSFLNQSMTMHHDEQFPLGIMPMLPFCDARFTDVDRNLSAIGGMHQFCKATAVIHIHFHCIFELFFRQISQVQAIQLLRKGDVRHLRHQQRLWLPFELLKQIYNLTEGNLMCHRNITLGFLANGNIYDSIITIYIRYSNSVNNRQHQIFIYLSCSHLASITAASARVAKLSGLKIPFSFPLITSNPLR